MPITAQHNQSLQDLAVKYYGDATAAYELAAVNRVAVDVELVPGTELIELDRVYQLNEFQPLVINQPDSAVIYTVQAYQSLQDIAVLFTGDATMSYALAALNDMRVDETLTAGTELVIGSIEIVRESVVDAYRRNGIVPATGIVFNKTAIFSNGYVQAGYVINGYVQQ